MRRLIYITLLCIGIPMGAGAQTFTQRLQQQAPAGQGSVTLHQSDTIDQLVNSAVLKTGTSTSTPSQPATTKTNSKTGPLSPSGKATASTQASAPPLSTPDTIPGGSRIMRGQKVMGYRVQAFAGGNSRKDRQQAEQVRNNIKSHFPNVPVYVHFYSPRWICRVGNYRTYEEAHQMLVSLRDLGFNQATIVKGKITVAY